ncbi:DUF2252 family protein [Bowmanella denitrificans]|uniref:DUF2252 family protein n=1 Tax=Bowmanella denitrificans TaxID=366582 RepID=UPI001FE3AAF5|nr:DUF2252 family protein [Bowmanella denitrificans]
MQRIRQIETELVRVDGKLGVGKHRKMIANPYVFMRGAAQLFYADLASGLLNLPQALLSVPLTIVMGDCHLGNFGFLTEEGSHGDQVIFSPNDFDDACIGHAVWDLARFCSSLLLCVDYCQGLSAGRYNNGTQCQEDPAVSPEQGLQAMHGFLDQYLNICKASIDVPESRMQVLKLFKKPHLLAKKQKKAVARAAGGEQFHSKSALAKAVDLSQFPPRFRHLPDKFRPLTAELDASVRQAFAPYMDDAILDIVRRLDAGTGSANMQRFYMLVGPANCASPDDLPLCHVVEVKKQRQAAPLHWFADLSQVNQLNPAHLTAVCQRRMQRRPDLLLDEVYWQGEHYLVRSRHHARVGIDPEDIGLGNKAVSGGFVAYAQACGQALALAHCRGDRRSVRFETAMADLLPGHKEALIKAVSDYAKYQLDDCNLLKSLLKINS